MAPEGTSSSSSPGPPDLVAVGRRLRRADELWGDEPDGRWRKGSRGGGSRGPGEVYEFDGVQSGLGGEMEDSGMGLALIHI